MKKSRLLIVCLLIGALAATALFITACGESALKGISVDVTAAKTDYSVGEEFDPAGIVITATFEDGTTKTLAASDVVFSGFDSSAVAASQTVTATYGGKTATFAVNIVADANLLLTFASESDNGLKLYKDGTYLFTSNSMNEIGLWKYENNVFGTYGRRFGSVELRYSKAEVDASGNISLSFTAGFSSRVQSEFTCAKAIWETAMGTSGAYNAVADETDTAEVLLTFETASDYGLKLYKNGTYLFTSDAMNEIGLWKYENNVFGTYGRRFGSVEIRYATASVDGSGNVSLSFTAGFSSRAKGDFTCTKTVWEAALGTTGAYTPNA